MGQGDWLPQQRVAHAEDGGGGADAERQSQYRGDRETRRFAQHALAVTDVLPQIHESRSPDGSTHGGLPWFEEFTSAVDRLMPNATPMVVIARGLVGRTRGGAPAGNGGNSGQYPQVPLLETDDHRSEENTSELQS